MNSATSPSYLYSEGQLFAVHKPAMVHSVRNTRTGNLSIADLLLQKEPSLARASRQEGDAGLLNRLDYETSGVLLGARTREAWDEIFALGKSDGVLKEYLAIVDGTLPSERLVDAWIGQRGRRSPRVVASFEEPREKYRAERMRSTFMPIRSPALHDATLVKVTITRGHRHQIRAHAALIGHPLRGDAVYGSTVQSAEQPPFLLHAWRVSFKVAGHRIVIESPIPPYFPELLLAETG